MAGAYALSKKWKGETPILPNNMTKLFAKKLGLHKIMAFFSSAITSLQTLVVALGAGLAVWGVINLLEGYGADNPAAND